VVIIALCGLNTLVGAYVVFRDVGIGRVGLVLVPGTIATAAMWWRRRYPLAVTALVGALYLVSQVLLPLGFGLLTIAVRRRDRVLVAATAVVALLLMVPDLNSPSPTFDLATVITGVVGALFWALWGAYVGARRDLVASLRERAVRAEEERERRADQARLAERARIAREMHDVLAHKVSLIALQAGGLEVNPGVGAERVQQTAGQIRSTAREALVELRGVLGVLRADQPAPALPDGSELVPQPGLAELTALVDSSRAAGVRITQSVDVAELPQATGRAVYRVVQEALTNVHKHARGAATDVAVGAGSEDGVVVTVTNQRPVSAVTLLPGSGAGLIGLRERVGLLGGTLTAGPTGDGGWRLRAWLPGAVPATARGSIPHGGQAAPVDHSARDDGTAAWLAS
jgi:signal transduction histidine kinase